MNRLIGAEGPYGTIDYTYDGVGNRLTKLMNGQTETYSYITGTNLIQDVTDTEAVTYSHDANGNITAIGDRTLTYNQNNRLIRVEENSDILGEYTYNGLGQRVIKEVNGITTVFHYDFDGNIVGESDQDGNFKAEYLYRGKGRVAKVDVDTGAMSYYLNDRLGTPLLMTDETNTVIWEGVYKPFGEADVNPNSSVVNNHRLVGQYFDEETGLHYNGFRFYNPRTGRYLTPDPIGQIGGINLYTYVLNDPINSCDLFGLLDIIDCYNISHGRQSSPFQNASWSKVYDNIKNRPWGDLGLGVWQSGEGLGYMGVAATLPIGLTMEAGPIGLLTIPAAAGFGYVGYLEFIHGIHNIDYFLSYDIWSLLHETSCE